MISQPAVVKKSVKKMEDALSSVGGIHARRNRTVRIMCWVLIVPIAVAAIVFWSHQSARSENLNKELVALEYRSLLHEAARTLSSIQALSSAHEVHVSSYASRHEALMNLRDSEVGALRRTLDRLESMPLSKGGKTLYAAWKKKLPDLDSTSTPPRAFRPTLESLLQFTEYYTIDSGLGTRFTDGDRGLLDYSGELIRLEAKAGGLRRYIINKEEETRASFEQQLERVRLALVYQRAEAGFYDSVFTGSLENQAVKSWTAVEDLIARSKKLADNEARYSAYDWYIFATAKLKTISTLHHSLDTYVSEKISTAIFDARVKRAALLVGSALLALFLFLATRRSKQLERREQLLLEELERVKRRYNLAVDGAQVGVFERPDVRETDSFWTPKIYELLKWSSSETPIPLLTLVHPDYRHILEESRDAIVESGDTTQLQAPLLCGDGEYRWFAINAAVNRQEDSGVVGLFGAMISINDLKEAEALASSEAKLRASVRELKRINEDLQQFSRMVSHDLQEPLRMITGFTELLEEDYGPKLGEQGLEYIKFASEGAQRMQEMLSGLMLYAKEGRREAEPKSIDLETLVGQILQEFAIPIKDASLKVNVNLEVKKVTVDPIGFTSILQNLIGNAIKYRREDGPTMDVHFSCTAEKWCLTVSDNGIGIDPKYRDVIFEPFRRLHDREAYEGSGIGLSLCKRIASNWRAQLKVDSVPGEGSTFTLTAPLLDRHYVQEAA